MLQRSCPAVLHDSHKTKPASRGTRPGKDFPTHLVSDAIGVQTYWAKISDELGSFVDHHFGQLKYLRQRHEPGVQAGMPTTWAAILKIISQINIPRHDHTPSNKDGCLCQAQA